MHPQKVASRAVKINGASAKTRIGTAYGSLKSAEIRLHCQTDASTSYIEHSSKNVNQFHFFLTDTNINPRDVKT